MDSQPFAPVLDSHVTAPSLTGNTPAPLEPSAEKTSIQQAVETGDTRTYRQERRRQREAQLTGKEFQSKPAKQAPGTPGSKPPVSATGATERPPKGTELRARNAELEADIQKNRELLRLRAEVRREVEQSGRSPAPPAPAAAKPADTTKKAWERYKDLPDAPKVSDFESYEDFVDARADFIADQRISERFKSFESDNQAQSQLHAKVQSFESSKHAYVERMTTWQQANPSVQLDPDFLKFEPMSVVALRNASLPESDREPIGPHHYITEQVFRSEVVGPLSAHFSAHPQEFYDLCKLAAGSEDGPGLVLRRIGQLEARFLDTPASSAASPSAPKPKPLPNPPTTLGRKSQGVVDPLKAAIQNGDTRAYRQLRREQRSAQIAS